MTRIEKKVVIRALSEYEAKYKLKAQEERACGEYKKASSSESESCIAGALMMVFSSILAEPAGSIKI